MNRQTGSLLVTLLMSLLVVSSVAAAGHLSPPTRPESVPAAPVGTVGHVVAADAPAADQGVATRRGGPVGGVVESGSPDASLIRSGGDENATVRGRVALVTGQTVTVVERGDHTQYRVDDAADTVMHRVQTDRGTYVYPDTVDFRTLSPTLFNVDLLLEQDPTGGPTADVPVIVRFRRDVAAVGTDAVGAARSLGVDGGRSIGALDAVAGRVAADATSEFVSQVRRSDAVERVYLDAEVRVANDFATNVTGADAAVSEFDVTGEGTTIAVLDTGVDETHPDLDDGKEVAERNFAPGENTTTDFVGHGTHVAATAAGTGDASGGDYAGYAPGAKILDVRVFDADGYGRVSTVIAGMEYAIDRDADVISMSLGGPVSLRRYNSLYAPTVTRALEEGTLVVAAAGNRGPDYVTVDEPAYTRGAIAVGATNREATAVAGFSSRGPTPSLFVKPDVLAPGTDVRSAVSGASGYDGPYADFTGTSMATPGVSGAAALLMDARPNRSVYETRATILSTARPLPGGNVYAQGSGRIDVERAIQSDVVVSPGTVDFGVYTTDVAVDRAVTVHNFGNETRTVSLTAEATNVLDEGTGSVGLTDSSVSVPAGESRQVALEVDTGRTPGVFSGRITATSDGETVGSTSFGYGRAFEVNVVKSPLSGANQTVEGDALVVKPHRDDAFGAAKTRQYGGGSVEFTSFGGELTITSPGVDEATGESVLTAATVTADADRTVVLEERETVRYLLDPSAVEEAEGPLAPSTLEATLQRPYSTPDGQSAFETGTLAPGADSARFSTGQAFNAGIESLLVPSSALSAADAPFDVPRAYLFSYATSGVSEARTFRPDPDELSRFDVAYHRTAPGQTYRSVPTAVTTTWPERGDVTVSLPVGDRQSQRISVNPSGAVYGVGATGTRSDDFASWLFAPALTDAPPNESTRVDVNRRPLVGKQLGWRATSEGLSLSAAFQTAPSGGLYSTRTLVSESGELRPVNNTVGLFVPGRSPVVADLAQPFPALTYERSSGPPEGRPVELVTVGRDRAQPLATRTVTLHSGTVTASGDGAPPVVSVTPGDALGPNNTVTADELTLSVTVRDESAVGLAAATGPRLHAVFGRNRTVEDWRSLDEYVRTAARRDGRTTVERVGSDRFAVTVNLTGAAGTVDVAFLAIDGHGNRFATATSDAFRVAAAEAPPPTETEAETPVETVATTSTEATTATETALPSAGPPADPTTTGSEPTETTSEPTAEAAESAETAGGTSRPSLLSSVTAAVRSLLDAG